MGDETNGGDVAVACAPLDPFPEELLDGTVMRTALGHGLPAQRPDKVGHRRGRLRRWYFSAAVDERMAVAAAIVDLGPVGTAFAWVHRFGAPAVQRTLTWDRTAPAGGGRGSHVIRKPSGGARFRGKDADITIGDDGTLHLRCTMLDADEQPVEVTGEVLVTAETPASLVTTTRVRGWNATVKAAGYPAAGVVRVGGELHALDGQGFRDWTMGRQDRRTHWRWAAGVGASSSGTRVGLNLSTGMNAHLPGKEPGEDAPGENLVWWGGTPHRVEVDTLEPTGDPATEPWRVAGPGWALDFAPDGVRQARENYLVVKSSYVAPIGTFSGTLPTPGGGVADVVLRGVTEDHEAVW